MGRNSNLLVSLALGLQLPRIVRVVCVRRDSCAIAAGQRIRRPPADEFWCLFSVAQGEQVDQEWTAPADAQPSHSAEVWKESDVKEVCPRPAQPRLPPSAVAPTAEATEKGPALLPGERSTGLRQELEELARSLDQAMPGAECPDGGHFLPAPSPESWSGRDGESTCRGPNGLAARRVVRRRRSPSASDERTRGEAEKTAKPRSWSQTPPASPTGSLAKPQESDAGERGFAKSSRSEGRSKRRGRVQNRNRERRCQGAGSGKISDGGDNATRTLWSTWKRKNGSAASTVATSSYSGYRRLRDTGCSVWVYAVSCGAGRVGSVE